MLKYILKLLTVRPDTSFSRDRIACFYNSRLLLSSEYEIAFPFLN